MSADTPPTPPPAPDLGPEPGEDLTPEIRQKGQKGKLGALFARRSTKIVGGVVLAFILIIMFGGKKEETKPSSLGIKPPDRQQTDPNMIDPKIAAIQKERDQKNATNLANNPDARNSGASYLPRVTNEVEDPLNSYAKASVGQGTPVTIPVPPPLPPAPPTIAPAPAPLPSNSGQGKENPRFIALTKAMKKARDTGRLDIDVKIASVDLKRPTEEKADPSGAPASTASLAPAGKTTAPKVDAKKIAGLGELFYGTMDLEANSDYSKFVQATIIGGQLDGAKVQGQFKLTTDRLEIVFTKIALNGKTMAMNAIATNPENPEVGLATDVNYHYLQRFGGVFTAALVRGYGEALESEGTRVAVNADTGTVVQETDKRSDKDLALIASADAADELSQYFRGQINRPPTVIVAANTPIGVLLRADLLEPLGALTLEQAPEEIPSQITPQPFPTSEDGLQNFPAAAPVAAAADAALSAAATGRSDRSQDLLDYAQSVRSNHMDRKYGASASNTSP